MCNIYYTYCTNCLSHRNDELGRSPPGLDGAIFPSLPSKHSSRNASLRRSGCRRDCRHIWSNHFIFIQCTIIIRICLKPVTLFIDQLKRPCSYLGVKRNSCDASPLWRLHNSNLIGYIIEIGRKYIPVTLNRSTYSDIAFQFLNEVTSRKLHSFTENDGESEKMQEDSMFSLKIGSITDHTQNVPECINNSETNGNNSPSQ